MPPIVELCLPIDDSNVLQPYYILTSYMIFPSERDIEKRIIWLAKRNIMECSKFQQSMLMMEYNIPFRYEIVFEEYDGIDILKTVKSKFMAGYITGELLLIALEEFGGNITHAIRAYSDRQNDPTKQSIVNELCDEQGYKRPLLGDTNTNYFKSVRVNSWDKYKHVSHFWAVYSDWLATSPLTYRFPEWDLFLERFPGGIKEFLRRSEALRRKCIQCHPKRTGPKTPLLDPNKSWRVPIGALCRQYPL
jgi:hypothetical protein